MTPHRQIDGLTLTGENNSATALENLLTRHRMRWGNAGDSYLCFTNLFSTWPIAVRIGPAPNQDHAAVLDFEFSDRFLSPVMISYVQKKFAAEMARMFKVFRSELPKRG